MHDVMNWIIIIVLFLLLTSTHISENDQKQYSTRNLKHFSRSGRSLSSKKLISIDIVKLKASWQSNL